MTKRRPPRRPKRHDPSARMIGLDTIQVEGGAKTPPLPPEQVYDGTPDPELARLIQEGRVRYHLDTLRQLEAESREHVCLPAWGEEDEGERRGLKGAPQPLPGPSTPPATSWQGTAPDLALTPPRRES